MQPQTITLAVDLLNTGSTTDVVYTREEEYINRSVYHAADHTPLMRHMLTVYRTPSKASGNFPGVQKSSCKITRDYLITGVDRETTLVGTVIHEDSNSVPLGIADEDMLVIRQTAIAFQDQDALSQPLMGKLSI